MRNAILFAMSLALVLSGYTQEYRYTNTIFESSVKTSNIIYGSAPFLNSPYNDESNTTVLELVMDIYQPEGDTETNRPAIIFAHGGGFSEGNRSVDDMISFCDTFARKGYVAITIDYRQGVEVADNGDMHYTRAAYRGLQDGRSAVRFLRANASVYGINPEMIFWGGNSAGSFIGLNSIYMSNDEKPIYASAVNYTIGAIPFSGPDLGDIDIGDYLNFEGDPDGVMACWGGVGDTLTIEPEDNQSVFLIHGSADNIVPFNSGTPFNLPGVSAVYGSNPINIRLNNIGLAAETYFVEGEDHEFYGVDNGMWENGVCGNEYWDTVVMKATNFYHTQHKPIADFLATDNGLHVDFSDLSVGAEDWRWDFGDGHTSIEQNPTHVYEEEGYYNILLYIENGFQSWDTVSHSILIDEIGLLNHNKEIIRIYPNPANKFLNIDFCNGYEMIVTNIEGETLLSSKISDINSTIDISEFAKGIYIIRLRNHQDLKIYKFIKN